MSDHSLYLARRRRSVHIKQAFERVARNLIPSPLRNGQHEYEIQATGNFSNEKEPNFRLFMSMSLYD